MTDTARRQPLTVSSKSNRTRRNGRSNNILAHRTDPDSALEWEFAADTDQFGDSARAARDPAEVAHQTDADIVIDPRTPQYANGGAKSSELHSAPSLVAVFRGSKSTERVNALRQALDDALDSWWTFSELPGRGLLRDGLLALEAGHSLDEVHRSLLFRTALHYRKGMSTALRHQTDPDRTAFLLTEVLLDEQNPFPVNLLWQLRANDDESSEWVGLLADELMHTHSSVTGIKRQLAERALRQLDQDTPISEAAPLQPPIPPASSEYKPRNTTPIALRLRIPLRWTLGRVFLLLCCAAVITMLYIWQEQRTELVEMAAIPAAEYDLGNNYIGVSKRTITLPAFALDRTEVTIASYRLCAEQGSCPWPTAQEGVPFSSRILDAAYADHPVTFVDWAGAQSYCDWAGKRLPSADEWEVAAAVAPATQRYYLYPWGNSFAELLANNRSTGVNDTQAVGSYHPAGDSSFGLSDMAGNVAEWTATEAGYQDEALYIVKGGSYADLADALQAHDSQSLAASTSASWLGFRCAVSLSDASTALTVHD